MEEMNALIGRTVSRLFVSCGEGTLYFDTETGVVSFDTDGDCCSESWFADVTGVDALLGAVVVAVDVMEMPDVTDNRSRQEHDLAYGAQLTTTLGRCVVAFRNSSNGYYGGWITGPIEGTEIPTTAKEITDDWSA